MTKKIIAGAFLVAMLLGGAFAVADAAALPDSDSQSRPQECIWIIYHDGRVVVNCAK